MRACVRAYVCWGGGPNKSQGERKPGGRCTHMRPGVGAGVGGLAVVAWQAVRTCARRLVKAWEAKAEGRGGASG